MYDKCYNSFILCFRSIGGVVQRYQDVLSSWIFAMCFERWSRNLSNKIGGRLRKEKHCKQNHGSVNIGRYWGTEER